MVIATVITTDVDVEEVKTCTLEQIRNNDQGLLNRLLDRGVEANVTTAILNIEEFLEYLHLRQRKRVVPAPAQPVTPPAENAETVVVTEHMSELDFMEYTFQQLQNGDQKPTVTFSAEALAVMEDEPIGEEFARQPFLY
ncbi:MAG: hypothetical protein DYG89_05115 [Caldilinea sp. CFX5]|nr:hypothetical protein [Caldilinea sp. CFX5]